LFCYERTCGFIFHHQNAQIDISGIDSSLIFEFLQALCYDSDSPKSISSFAQLYGKRETLIQLFFGFDKSNQTIKSKVLEKTSIAFKKM
jgi:hypothetical protein